MTVVRSIVNRVIAVLLFSFPLLAVLVEHWASGIYALIAITALVLWRRPQPPLLREESWFVAVLLLFVISTIASNTVSGWSDASIRWFEAVSRILFAIPLFLYLRAYPGVVLYLLRAVPIAAAITGGYVAAAVILEGVRVYGPYNPIFIGNAAILFVITSLVTMHYPTYPARYRIPIHLAGAAIGMVAVVLSGTRSAWLVALLVLPLAVYFAVNRISDPRFRRRLAFGALVVAAAVILAGFVAQPRLTQNRLAAAVEQTGDYLTAETREQRFAAAAASVGIRLEQWRAGLQIFADHPLFGVGVGNTGREINRRIEDGDISPSIEVPAEYVDDPVHLHSAYVDALVFKGIVGLFALVCLLFYPVALGMQRSYRAAAGRGFVICVSLVFAVMSLTADPFIRNGYTSIYLIFVIGALTLLFSAVRTAPDHR